LVKPPPPNHGALSCSRGYWTVFGGYGEICEVKCQKGFVPEKPHARLYAYFGGKLTTVPAGSEFPWADCVRGKDTFLK